MRRSSGRAGFTLIELLTVIAIIAILAAIIFPVMATVRRNVYKAQCTTNLHSIGQALKMYKDDYRLYPEALFGYVGENGPRTFLFPTYIREEATFRCPLCPSQVSDTTTLPAVHPTTGGPDPITRKVYRWYAFDSYDGSRVPHPGGPYQLHYTRKWSPKPIGFQDDPRQLMYRNPPDSTVVTWCTYHRGYVGNQPEQGSIDLVLFLDGSVKPIPTDRMLAVGEDITRPYRMTPTGIQ